jgi:toxin ParE1/3/4
VALAWYQARSPRAATRFDADVERVLGLIGTSPEMFPSYDDEHRFAFLKRLPYSLVYRIEPGRVYMIAVPRSSRSTGYWQGRA